MPLEAPAVFQRGAVVRVTLRNFLTYDDVTVRPGAQLNLLIGPNGTGKSTIVAALVLGLAGAPSVLGRASKVEHFIKDGAQEGFIELELFDEAGNHIISRTIQKNKSLWKYGGVTVTQERVKEVVAQLNIQVDNLCQILPQERVQEFVKLNAQGLLEGTEKAVGYAGMYEDHQRLKKGDEEETTLTQQLEDTRTTLEANKLKIDGLQAQVNKQKTREKYENKVAMLKHRREWLKFELAQKEYVKLNKIAEEAKKKLRESQDSLKPLKDRVTQSKEEVAAFQLKLDNCTRDLCSKQKAVDSQLARAKQVEKRVATLGRELQERQTREAERRQRADGFREKLEYVTRQMAEAEECGDALDAEIRTCDAKIQQLSARESARQNEQEARTRRQDELRGHMNHLQAELKGVRSVADQRLELLRQRNNDTYKAVLWLRQNGSLFERAVHEPMILLLDVSDVRLAKFVQAAVPWNDLLAFTCESRTDMNAFLQETRERQRLRISCVLSDPTVALESFRPQRSVGELRALGFSGAVGGLFACPDAVRRYLYQTHQLHNIPVADVGGEAADRVLHATQGQRKLNFFMIGDFKYRSGQSRYSGREWTSSEPLGQPDGILTLTTDTARERELLATISENEEEMKQLRQSAESTQSVASELAAELEEARRCKRALTGRRDRRRNLEASQRATERSLRECESQACDLPALERQTAARVEEQLGQLSGVHAQLLAESAASQALELDSKSVRLQIHIAHRRCSEAQLALDEGNGALEELRQAAANHTNAANAQETKMAQLRRAALDRLQLSDDDQLSTKLGRRFPLLPNTMEAIDEAILENQAHADMLLIDDDDDTLRQYEQLMRENSELSDALERLAGELTRLRSGMADRRQRWLQELMAIVVEINEHFSRFLSDMDCAGEVALSQPADGRAAGFGIVIRVKFRAAEKLCDLSATHHSGGERSVATMLYIVALQHLARTVVPFHCVDEINQGMDARNERRVFELVVRAACRDGGAQYFLVTPKLLPGLQYPDSGLTVLCVFNSPTMLPHTDWDLDAFCRRKRQKRDSMTAAMRAL